MTREDRKELGRFQAEQRKLARKLVRLTHRQALRTATAEARRQADIMATDAALRDVALRIGEIRARG